MTIWGIWDSRRIDITADQLGRDVEAYVSAARRQGLADDEIEADLCGALDRSPIPADDVRVRGAAVEIDLFD